ncbi:catalase [soil metagenome]
MASKKTSLTGTTVTRRSAIETRTGKGGELHQTSSTPLTTNQGSPVADDQNSLRVGARGPTLLEDFHFLEKITHFDHERIPERIVHARGSAAHGTFRIYKSLAHLTRAKFLADPSVETPVFVRISTVAGGAGSVDTPRDVRGFAVKFYTEEGNFDLVGNNMPVFFIQDAIKFPDLIHAVKMEPDRGYPQAASAHDTFWDFVSLMPESMHMLMWAMSDRAIPRSLRMIDGFGIHTFRLIDAKGKSTFVKFHWRPKLGVSALLWDEAVKIQGADNDYHRRDLFEAIARGDFPEWELGLQVFDQKMADSFEFDVLDPTKLIPEEKVPVQLVGKMTLDRNPDNFFAETEQVAFHPGHVVPGIDFSNDPLLQGRLFSYTDTQLSRLGGPNFHEREINKPKCPMHNFQRDGIARQAVPKGRAAYEPNSLDDGSAARESPAGFVSFPAVETGEKVRVRSETFADHYSQARLFFESMTDPEKSHIVSAFSFELSKVVTPAIRTRMLGHLDIIHPNLGQRVATALGLEGMADTITPAMKPRALPPSPALSMLLRKPTLEGRSVGVLVSDGFDAKVFADLKRAVEAERAQVVVIGPKIGGAKAKDGTKLAVDQALRGAPSVLFDAVAVLGALEKEPVAVDWVRDAFAHLKAIGHTAAAAKLIEAAGVKTDVGVIVLDAAGGVKKMIDAARSHRIWTREPPETTKS